MQALYPLSCPPEVLLASLASPPARRPASSATGTSTVPANKRSVAAVCCRGAKSPGEDVLSHVHSLANGDVVYRPHDYEDPIRYPNLSMISNLHFRICALYLPCSMLTIFIAVAGGHPAVYIGRMGTLMVDGASVRGAS